MWPCVVRDFGLDFVDILRRVGSCIFRSGDTTAGIAQLVGHGPHGWARLCGIPDSLLMTHGLLLKIGLHGGRYDPQPVTRSSEREWGGLNFRCAVDLRGTQQEAANVRTGVDGGISGGGGTGGTIGGGWIAEWAPRGAIVQGNATAGVCRMRQVGDELQDWTTSHYAAPRLRQHPC